MRIDRYDVLAEVGRGGGGVVYRARGPEGDVVAIKVLAKRGDEARARFDRERRLLSALNESQGFVPLLASGESQGALYIVMPFVGGGTLRDRLKRGPLAAGEVHALGVTLARAMGRAHGLGIVHRDLKPENVLFTEDGRPLISDLGASKYSSSDSDRAPSADLSKTGEFRGTIGYMPPEQMRSARGVGATADVFALGAVLHECVSGKPAFIRETVFATVDAVERCRPAPLPRDASPSLVAAIERALSRAPERRFPDGESLALAIEGNAPSRRPIAAIAGTLAVLGVAGVLVAARAWGGSLESASQHPTPSLAPSSAASSFLSSSTTVVHATPSALADARSLLKQGKVALALESADRALEREPGSAEAFAARGAVELALNDVEGAARDLEKACSIAPRIANAWTDRARVRLTVVCRGEEPPADASAEMDLALQEAERAIACDARHAKAYETRAWAHALRTEADPAIADIGRAVRLDPTVTSSWAGQRDFGACLRNTVIRETLVGRALEKDPRTTWALAAQSWMRRDKDDGRELARTAVAIEPRLTYAWYVLAVIQHSRDATEGHDAAVRATTIDPTFTEGWLELAAIDRDRGELDLALPESDRALETAPRMPRAWSARARVHTMRRELAAALEDAERAIELDPRDPVTWETRGCARQAGGDLVSARADADHAIELGLRSRDVFEIRGLAKAKAGDRDGAIADLELAVKLPPFGKTHAERIKRELEEIRDYRPSLDGGDSGKNSIVPR